MLTATPHKKDRGPFWVVNACFYHEHIGRDKPHPSERVIQFFKGAGVCDNLTSRNTNKAARRKLTADLIAQTSIRGLINCTRLIVHC